VTVNSLSLGTIFREGVDEERGTPVVDFDHGGRLPIELTDVEADDLTIGDRVEMTFRRLFTAHGVHNYFWKARPVRPQV